MSSFRTFMRCKTSIRYSLDVRLYSACIPKLRGRPAFLRKSQAAEFVAICNILRLPGKCSCRRSHPFSGQNARHAFACGSRAAHSIEVAKSAFARRFADRACLPQDQFHFHLTAFRTGIFVSFGHFHLAHLSRSPYSTNRNSALSALPALYAECPRKDKGVCAVCGGTMKSFLPPWRHA